MYGFFLSQATFPWNSEVVSWELKQTRNASYHWKRCVRCSSNVGRRTGKRGERWQTTPNESVVYWQRANECPFVLLLFCMENNQQPFREIWTQADARTQTETCHVFRVRHGRVIMMAVHNLSLSVCVPVCMHALLRPSVLFLALLLPSPSTPLASNDFQLDGRTALERPTPTSLPLHQASI